MLRAFEDDYGVEVIHAWGMTEMSPIGTLGKLLPEHGRPWTATSQVKAKLKQGRAPFGVEMKIIDDDGKRAAARRQDVRPPAGARARPWRAPTSRTRRANAKGECLDAERLLRHRRRRDASTNSAIMQITDRAKDVIKSGGEWISSIDIENIAVGAEGVACAAVIGVRASEVGRAAAADHRAEAGRSSRRAKQLLAFLEGKIAKWWMPDDVVFVEKIPLGATGKINKLALRETFKTTASPTRKRRNKTTGSDDVSQSARPRMMSRA